MSAAVEITVYPQALQEAGFKVGETASDDAVALGIRPRVIDTRHSTTDTAMRTTQLQEFFIEPILAKGVGGYCVRFRVMLYMFDHSILFSTLLPRSDHADHTNRAAYVQGCCIV